MMSGSSDIARLVASAGVPAFNCPPGTKMRILDLGTLEADESWYVWAFEAIFKALIRLAGFFVEAIPARYPTRTRRINVVN